MMHRTPLTQQDYLESIRACAFELLNATHLGERQAELVLDVLHYAKGALHDLEREQALARARAG